MPDTARAAEVIKSCWREGTVVDYVKGDLWPDTVEQGYAMQAALAELRKEPVEGWKIAATAIAGRQHINVDRPMAGRLFPSICHEDGATIPFSRNRMAVAEAEFVLRLARICRRAPPPIPRKKWQPASTNYTPDSSYRTPALRILLCLVRLH